MFRRFMETVSEHLFEIVILFGIVGIPVIAGLHECHESDRRDRCEDQGGTVVDRNKSSWRCVKPGQAEASKAAP